MLKVCLVLGMTIAVQGERPRDDFNGGGIFNTIEDCRKVGRDWIKNVKNVKHAWAVCTPELSETYVECEKLNTQ